MYIILFFREKPKPIVQTHMELLHSTHTTNNGFL